MDAANTPAFPLTRQPTTLEQPLILGRRNPLLK